MTHNITVAKLRGSRTWGGGGGGGVWFANIRQNKGGGAGMVFKIGKRYVPEKEYIHMISSYITADWSNIE